MEKGIKRIYVSGSEIYVEVWLDKTNDDGEQAYWTHEFAEYLKEVLPE